MIAIVKADLTQTEHAEALVYLLNEYACDPMGGGTPLSQQVQQHLANELQKRPFVHSYIAFDDRHPVGLINLVEGFSTFAARPLLNIHDVMVIHAYRGQGVATRLFESAELLAKELGCVKLTLEVLEGNKNAQLAYRRLGFKPYQLDPETGVAQFWQKKL